MASPGGAPCRECSTGERLTIFSIGHSTRPIEEFLALLRAHGVNTLLDIRTIPRSRHNPQFGQQALEFALGAIVYVHLPELGGLRHERFDSPNLAWRNESFRGFADYMLTKEFAHGIQRLLDLTAQAGPLAIMCAEAVPWRCHRSLVSDALLARGVRVQDILGPGATRPHELTRFAQVQGQQVRYPGPAAPSELLVPQPRDRARPIDQAPPPSQLPCRRSNR
jgi:uncharacterized protein (DUF488 family)